MCLSFCMCQHHFSISDNLVALGSTPPTTHCMLSQMPNSATLLISIQY